MPSHRWLSFLCGLVATASAFAGEPVNVTFRVHAESMPEPHQVFLAGDHETLGNWNAMGVALTRESGHEWVVTLPFEPGTELLYKFTRGAWAQEALTASGDIPPNHEFKVVAAEEVHHTVLKWKDEDFVPRGQITGTVKRHPQMEARGLNPRDVLVWLPPGYETDTDARYPVLYMHDGQQIFDPVTTTHGIDWQVDEWATYLIEQGFMEKIIIVGNYCTDDRGDEYGENDEKDPLYRAFLSETLKPFIDKTYRTLPEREHTAVMGASMGGIASFKMVYKHNDLFSMAGCLSSAFWMDFGALAESEWPKQPVKIYLDNGGVGLEKKLQPGNDEMLNALEQKGFVRGENLLWCLDAEAEHNEEAWSKRVWMPLLYFFGTGDNPWINELPTPPAMPANPLLIGPSL